jgi:hypothetical protein
LAAVTLGAGWGPPIPVAPTVRTGELTTSRDSPSPVALDAGWLVLWEDARHSSYLGPQLDTTVAAYGARVSATNTGSDPAGLRVSTAPFDQLRPNAACIGSQCMATWQQASLGIMVRAFDAAAGTFGPERMISTVPPIVDEHASPRVVVLGGQYDVFWGTAGALLARMVQTDGTPMGLTETKQDNAPTNHNNVTGVSDGTRAMVVWFDDATGTLSGELVNSLGAVTAGPFQIATGADGETPALAVVPTGFLIVWLDAQLRPAFRRYGFDGTPLDAAAVYPLGALSGCGGLALVSDGANYIFGCCDIALHLVGVSAATLALLTPDQPTSVGSTPALLGLGQALNGTLLATWSEPAGGGPAVFSGLVNLGVSPLVPTSIVTLTQQLPDVQLSPRVARLGNGFAVAYLSFVGGQRTAWLAAFDSVGNSLSAPVLLDPATDLWGIDVDCDPVTGLTRVAWARELGVFVATLDAAGRPGPATRLSANRSATARLTSFGGRAFVGWIEIPNEVHGGFIELDGGASPAISPLYTSSATYALGLDVAASSTGFAVVWSDPDGASFAQVAATGAPLGIVPLPTIAFAFVDSLGLSSDGTGFLAVANGNDLNASQAVRFNAAGQLIDPGGIDFSAPEVLTPSNDVVCPDVVWDGQRYVIAYTERVADGGGFEVYVRTVDTDAGTVGPIERLGVGPGAQHSPALAAAPGGTVALVWLDGQESAVGVDRAFLSIRSGAGGLDGGADGGGAQNGDAGRGPWTLAAGCGCNSSGAPWLWLLLVIWPRMRLNPGRGFEKRAYDARLCARRFSRPWRLPRWALCRSRRRG